MAWEDASVKMLRGILFDLGSSPTYSDEDLEVLISAAAIQVQTDTGISNYTIDVVHQTISPDPTDQSDDSFLVLTALKAACMLSKGEFRAKARNAIKVNDGRHSIDTRHDVSASSFLKEGYCKDYKEALNSYLQDGVVSTDNIITTPIKGYY